MRVCHPCFFALVSNISEEKSSFPQRRKGAKKKHAKSGIQQLSVLPLRLCAFA
jgi:hypothetical protein